MKKQVFALVASGLLLASGATFAQPEQAAAGTGGSAAATGGAAGGLGVGTIVVATAIVGAGIAAASDSGDGGSDGPTATVAP